MKEKWKSMTLKEKTEYLWMYYKSWLFGFLIVIALIGVGIMMHHNRSIKVLLNVAVVGGNNQKAEEFQEDFAAYEGIMDKDGVIRVKANIPDESSGTSLQTILTTLMGAEALDVLVCTEGVYEEYSKQEGFLSMEEVLGGDAGNYGERVLHDGIVLDGDSILKKKEMVQYDKIYVAVSVNCQNKEMAGEFVRYLLK